ncbi:unnamed protein product [Closterium sp. NIES-54]
MAAAKRVLRYLCSTSGLGLVLGGRRPVVLTSHADASWADDQATQRSSQGYTFSLGSGSVSWRSTRSSSVLGSSCEAEIYTGAMAAQELRWLTYLLADLGEPPSSPPVMYVDNKAMMALCREHRLEHRTKHIALRYFLARELQQRGQLRLAYVASEANTADIFTKALPPGDHQRFCTMLGFPTCFESVRLAHPLYLEVNSYPSCPHSPVPGSSSMGIPVPQRSDEMAMMPAAIAPTPPAPAPSSPHDGPAAMGALGLLRLFSIWPPPPKAAPACPSQERHDASSHPMHAGSPGSECAAAEAREAMEAATSLGSGEEMGQGNSGAVACTAMATDDSATAEPAALGEQSLGQQPVQSPSHGSATCCADPAACAPLERPFSPTCVLDPPDWATVAGLDSLQLPALQRLASHGVIWKHPATASLRRFTLHYGGEVDADGNCLFAALNRLVPHPDGAAGLRRRAVRRFMKEYEAGVVERARVDAAVRHLYAPDVGVGWGVHVVQEVKLLAPRAQRAELMAAVGQLVDCGMSRDHAVEMVARDRCLPVDCARRWAHYMALGAPLLPAGAADSSGECAGVAEWETEREAAGGHDVVSLQYAQDGLLSASASWDFSLSAQSAERDAGAGETAAGGGGGMAAFGDDMAIEMLATELAREIIVVQAHGHDAMVDEQSALFFLPHAPRGAPLSVAHPPLFLLMKGTAWCGAGGDHYEAMVAVDQGEVPVGDAQGACGTVVL